MFDRLLNIDQAAVHKHVLCIDFVCFYLFSCVFCCCFVCCGGGVGWDILCINSVSIEHIIYTSTGLKYFLI